MTQFPTQSTESDVQSEEERQLIRRLRTLREQQRTVEDQLIELQAQGKEVVEKANGAAVAMIVAAGFGVFLIGLARESASSPSLRVRLSREPDQ